MPKSQPINCKCLTKHEKDTLIGSLNTSKIDAERILIESERGIVKVGIPISQLKKELGTLIGSYTELKDKIEAIPIC